MFAWHLCLINKIDELQFSKKPFLTPRKKLYLQNLTDWLKAQ